MKLCKTLFFSAMQVEQLKSSHDYWSDNELSLPKNLAFILHMLDQTFSLLPGANGRKLDRVTINGVVCLIGIQLAKVTRRTTYNLYRAMRVHGIRSVQASKQQLLASLNGSLGPFLSNNCARGRVTFIPLVDALLFFQKRKYLLKPA